jgi:hypothetical protein
MSNYDDLGNYNGDPTHDMMADYDHYMNTDEPSEYYEDEDVDDDEEFIYDE